MWQVHGTKAVALTRGGLVGDRKEAVTTNDEKSAEAIVGVSRRAEQSTQTKKQEGILCEETRKRRQLPLDAN